MTGSDKDIIIDAKYAPPYPQGFHRFWPKHALKAGIAVLITFVIIVLLSYFFRVPTDHMQPPLPDHGAYVPAPEWYLLFLFEPFWYLVGDNAVWLQIGTFWVPLAILLFLVVIPFFFGRKRASGHKLAMGPRLALASGVSLVWIGFTAGVVGSGYQNKTTSCISCHTPMVDQTQALPPLDMAKYFRETRQIDIEMGRHRPGETGKPSESYKDANWQLRHFYEPTEYW